MLWKEYNIHMLTSKLNVRKERCLEWAVRINHSLLRENAEREKIILEIMVHSDMFI